MAKTWRWLALIAVVFVVVACQQVTTLRQGMRAAATVEAERYPWAVYPISEESKAALCEALVLPPQQDELCQQGTAVYHWDVFKKVKEVFPPGRTTYAEVEANLGDFPHVREESRQPDGTMVGLRYAHQLTEYEGACIYFELDINRNKDVNLETNIVTRIYSTKAPGIFDGPIPEKCGPAQ